VKFNYLLPKYEQHRPCAVGGTHYYLPTTHVESTLKHVAVRFRCKKCGELATAFFTQEEFFLNENLLNKYTNGV